MPAWSLLREVVPPGPILSLIWPVFLGLGLLALWAGGRRPWLAALALLAVLALGADLAREARHAAAAPAAWRPWLAAQWRQAYLAAGLGAALAAAGLWRGRGRGASGP